MNRDDLVAQAVACPGAVVDRLLVTLEQAGAEEHLHDEAKAAIRRVRELTKEWQDEADDKWMIRRAAAAEEVLRALGGDDD